MIFGDFRVEIATTPLRSAHYDLFFSSSVAPAMHLIEWPEGVGELGFYSESEMEGDV